MFVKVGRHFDADVTEMPRLIEKAGDVKGLERIAERKAVLMGVFQEPDAFAGFVKNGTVALQLEIGSKG